MAWLKNRVISGHSFLNGDADLRHVVWPATQNCDLLRRRQRGVRDDGLRRSEDRFWVQHGDRDIDGRRRLAYCHDLLLSGAVTLDRLSMPWPSG